MTQKGSLVWRPGRSDDGEYAPVVERFLGREFPQLSTGDVEDLMEAVVLAFFGSKQTRQGPRPNPESEVQVRDVVRRAIAAGRPIPLYIPSAAVKVPVGKSSLDLAELSALRMLEALQHCVQRHYSPGFSMRMRMEDLTEYVLSGTGGDVTLAVSSYLTKLASLVKVLGMDEYLQLIPESSLVDNQRFLEKAAATAEVIEGYLRGERTLHEAESVGLRWPISQEMRDYFSARYKKLYPHYDEGDHIAAMAAYFSSTLTRRELQASGYDQTFDGRLELYFGIRLPDAPQVSTRVYWRTAPRSETSLHIPYWQAKGHLYIPEQGDPKIKLGTWDGEYEQGSLELVGNGTAVTIAADYIQEG